MALQIVAATNAALPRRVGPFKPRAMQAAQAVKRLSSGAARTFTPLPRRQTKSVSRPVPRSSGGSAVVTRAGNLTIEAVPENSRDYAPVLGILGLVMWHFNRMSLNAPLLLKTIAFYQLAVAGTALIFRRAELDNMASVVAPAVLAVAVININHVTYMDAAIALFGYYLAEHLEGPFWLWIGSLAAAIYAGYPSQWFVAATALAAGLRLVRNVQNKDVLPILTVPTVLAAVWAFWKEVTPQFTIALIIGSIVASGLRYAESVSDSS